MIGKEPDMGIVREIAACLHVVVNPLALDRPENFYVRDKCYLIVEEQKLKILCPACLFKGLQPISA
jgi:hypothetical protein